MDIAMRHLYAIAGREDLRPSHRVLVQLWSEARRRFSAGEVSRSALARCGSYLHMVYALPPEPVVARSRVRDDHCVYRRGRAGVQRCARFPPAPRVRFSLHRVRPTLAQAWGSGISSVGRCTAACAGLDTSNLGGWRSLYVRYESHSIVARALETLGGRWLQRAGAEVQEGPVPKIDSTHEIDVVVRRSPGHSDLTGQGAACVQPRRSESLTTMMARDGNST